MQYQLIDEAEVTEPVSLAEVKAYCRIDADYTSEDTDLEITMSAARIRLEQYLNIGFANRDVTLQWTGGLIDLPLSPNGDVVTLTDKDDVAVPTDKYTVSAYQAKKIFINDVAGGNYNYFYSSIYETVEISGGSHCADITDIYTLVYNTGYEDLPKALKQALLAEIDYLYKLRGMPVSDVVSPNAALLANGYSRNLVL